MAMELSYKSIILILLTVHIGNKQQHCDPEFEH